MIAIATQLVFMATILRKCKYACLFFVLLRHNNHDAQKFIYRTQFKCSIKMYTYYKTLQLNSHYSVPII